MFNFKADSHISARTMVVKGKKSYKTSKDEALEFSESIINTICRPLIVLDKDLKVVQASPSFHEFFKVKNYFDKFRIS